MYGTSTCTGVQALHHGDAEQHLRFCHLLIRKINDDTHFVSFVLWTDETIFTRRHYKFSKLSLLFIEQLHLNRSKRFQHDLSINIWEEFLIVIYGSCKDLIIA